MKTDSRLIIFYSFSLLLLIFNLLRGGDIQQINSYETWDANPRIIPSTDPAGITWDSNNWHFFIVDSEINENNEWNNENIFETNATGSILYDTYMTRPEASLSSEREPTGICYNPVDNSYYIVNDDRSILYKYQIDFGILTQIESWDLNISPFFITDAEGITINANNQHFYVADGASGDNKIVALQIDGSSLIYLPQESFSSLSDAEGIAYRPSTSTLFIVSSADEGIFEYELNGNNIDFYDISGFTPTPINPQGLTFGPRSTNNSYESIYIADGGIDNGSGGDFKDGIIYEAKIGLDDTSLPIQLSNFTADFDEKTVLLKWATESEINNVGFEVLRADKENGAYNILSSYKDNSNLSGHGNSSIRHEYSYVDELVEFGKTYWYRLADLDISGIKTFHDPILVTLPEKTVLPSDFKIHPNYPNPFNPTTKIKFEIPKLISDVTETKLVIYNNLGQVVKTIKYENLSPGTYEVKWNGTTDFGNQATSGIYFANLIFGPYSQSIKMSLLR